MKTYSTQFTVGAEHLDKGDHANWLRQLAIAEDMHHSFRATLGIGLELMKEEHGLFLVMGHVKDVYYRKQLRRGDVVDAEITAWISSRASLEFHCLFRIAGQTVTEMSWVMPLVSFDSEGLCKIPPWMTDIIGSEKP